MPSLLEIRHFGHAGHFRHTGPFGHAGHIRHSGHIGHSGHVKHFGRENLYTPNTHLMLDTQTNQSC